MSVRELPAIEWLGYSIDLSRSPTMDLRAASRSVLKGRRIIDFNADENLREVDINGVVYYVPGAVHTSHEPFSEGNFLSYPSGNDAQRAFQLDAGLPARYFAITGTDSAVALDRVFINKKQYAFFSFTHSVYEARLADYIDLLNAAPLLLGVGDLPERFDGNDEGILAAYKGFFQRFGSHVIVTSNYGARFQLNAWASNSDASVNARFVRDVKAYFNGIPDGGKYDETVKFEPQYKIFFNDFQRTVTAVGGETQLASDLTSDPTDWETYSNWLDSVHAAIPTLINFRTIAIWTLMSASSHNILKSYARELDLAFTWILSHPRVYKTAVTFDIQSDWGEFNLLTPDALIVWEDASSFPPQTIISSSRVQWGKQYSHDYQRQTLRFFIVNEGSPVDFSISHGSSGARPRLGRAEALIESKQYLNDVITDNVWNTMWFFGAAVSPTPETFQLGTSIGSEYSWSNILDEYLHTIGGTTQVSTGGEWDV